MFRKELLVFALMTMATVQQSSYGLEENEYQGISVHLRKAWSEYRNVQKGKETDKVVIQDQDSIRTALERVYRLQGKEREANFIGSASNLELEQTCSKLDNGKITDFPQSDTPAYRVIRRPDNSFAFTSLVADKIFSIGPNDPHYAEVTGIVGNLELGDSKKIPKLPFTTPRNFSILSKEN